MNADKVQQIVRELLVELGEDPGREGLVRTPARVAAAFDFLTSGYRADLEALINNAIFTQETNNMIVARDIEIYSLCEDHLLPFFGRCHIGYIAEKRVFGISKLARLADSTMVAARQGNERGSFFLSIAAALVLTPILWLRLAGGKVSRSVRRAGAADARPNRL